MAGNTVPESVYLHLVKGQPADELPAPPQSLANGTNDDVLHVPAVLPLLPGSPVGRGSHRLEVRQITALLRAATWDQAEKSAFFYGKNCVNC